MLSHNRFRKTNVFCQPDPTLFTVVCPLRSFSLTSVSQLRVRVGQWVRKGAPKGIGIVVINH